MNLKKIHVFIPNFFIYSSMRFNTEDIKYVYMYVYYINKNFFYNITFCHSYSFFHEFDGNIHQIIT